MTHQVELVLDERDDATFGPKVPAGKLKVNLAVGDGEVEIAGHWIAAGSVPGQAQTLKSLVFAASQLAGDLGYTLESSYIDRLVAGEERDRREAYANAVEIY